MVHVLDRVPVERITARSREHRPGPLFLALIRALMVALAGLLYVMGWLAAKALRAIWTACTWMAAAVELGWKDGLNGGTSR
jgi:hypothetical protein